MSLKKNILANYASQFYITLIGIVMVPLYINYMGVEAYGLVGFFAMLQAWFNLMDIGLTPTLARETARYNGGSTDKMNYRCFVRALEGVFVSIAVIGGAVLFLAADWIAVHWLKAAKLPIHEIVVVLKFIAVIVAVRWMCSFYRGIISGFEHLVWLSGFNIGIATLRFVGVLIVLELIDASPSTFFQYQLIVTSIELVGLAMKAYKSSPTVSADQTIVWSLGPIKSKIKFSLTIAFTTSVWVLITQTDKLILSKILSLADYGYFTLAVLVASGIMIVGGPVSSALMPRMVNLEAQGKEDEMIRLYRDATQFVAVVAGAAAIFIALGAEAILQAWTGNTVLSNEVAPILRLYACGNGVLTLAAFPYYLQYAKGNLNLHLIGNAIFVILFIPTIVIVSGKYHGIGAGYVWLGINLLSFIAWLPFVYRKFAPKLTIKWYCEDILLIVVPMVIVGGAIRYFVPFNGDKIVVIMEMAFMCLSILVAGIISSSSMRQSANKLLSINKNIDK